MKRIIVPLLALMFSASVFAQTPGSGRFGVTGGFTSSSLESSKLELQNVSQYHLGLAYKLDLVGGFTLQPEILYNVKGSALEGHKLDTKVGYVEVPVQIQWGMDIDKLRPYVFAEPFIGYGVNINSEIGSSYLPSFSLSSDSWDLVKSRLEYGFGLGAGVDLGVLQVSAKYFRNLGQFYDVESSIEAIKELVKDLKSFNGFAVSVGLFF